jgi:GNAT superfamily N-acetyltransferase
VSSLDVRFASSPSEREAVFRLRYDVYVEELRMFGGVADHESRRLEDEHDPQSRLLLARVDGEPVGTMRLTWGGDAPFPAEFRETYAPELFAHAARPDQVIFVTRFMVRPDQRGGTIPFRLIEAAMRFGLEHGVEVGLCDCQPHLLHTYFRLGFRSYHRTYNDPQMALMVPLALVIRDVEHLQGMRSPLRACVEGVDPTDATAAVVSCLPERPPVRSVTAGVSRDWGGTLRLFAGLTEDELADALAQSHVVDAEPGQLLIGRGQMTRTMYVVLDGSLDVLDGGRLVRRLGPGAAVGEIAFLLRRPRTLDVVVGATGARLLSLHEPALRELLDERSHAAAVLLLNLASSLAEQLAGGR